MTLADRLAARAPLLIVAAGLGALATAMTAQYWGGLRPCVLCVWQRWPWGIAAALGLVAAIAPTPFLRRAALGLATLALATGAGIGGFHVGVEQGWWEGTSGCTGGATPDSLDALRALVLAAPVVRCTDIPWSFAGVSMAGFNMIASALAAVGAGWAVRRV